MDGRARILRTNSIDPRLLRLRNRHKKVPHKRHYQCTNVQTITTVDAEVRAVGVGWHAALATLHELAIPPKLGGERVGPDRRNLQVQLPIGLCSSVDRAYT